MAALRTIADRRLRNILSHLCPPVIANASELSQPSRCSASCSESGISESGHNVEPSASRGDLGVVENGSPCRETMFQCGKLFEIECRGPNANTEAQLLESLMMSRLRRFKKCDAAMDESELSLVPCRGERNSQDRAEGHEDVKLETKGLENFNGVSSQAKWTIVEVDGVAAKLISMDLSDSETPRGSEEHGNGDSNCGVSNGEGTGLVRSGITSASAVSSSGAGASFNEGQSVANLKMDKKSKSIGPLTALRVASCEFCDIIHGTAPCFKLYEDELCLCILDINPLSLGHSLILPKAHFPCLEATPPQIAAAMCAAVPLISSALLAATRCDSFNMLVNSGVAAGQVIMHTHFHIIPRCRGDGLWKSESAYRRPLQKVQEAKLLAHVVRTKLSSTAGLVS